MKQASKVKKSTATERLKALETVIMGHDGSINSIIQTVKIITENLEKLIDVSGLREQLEAELMNDNVKQMEQSLSVLIEQGTLIKKEESGEIDEKTYVYAREVNSEGDIVNPRLHFAMPVVPEEDQKDLLGKKAGDVVFKADGSDVGLEIMELFEITSMSKGKK